MHEKSQQYNLAKEQSPSKYPGPQQYFKTHTFDRLNPNPKPGEENAKEKEQPEGSPKMYYQNRDRTDKRIYKPMKSYVF
jgi:hypothetical protein